jgi:phage protein, HK97 gp10 family
MSRLSVLNFRASLRGIGKEMDKLMGGSVLDEAEGLAGAMRQAASSHAKSGKTQKSIRVIKRRGNRVTVAAGGELTTKDVRGGSGVSYDYVRAEEFGTSDQKAIPFFWNTYRARKRGIKDRVSGKAASALK